jgi:cysteinyl-tRNA synthetase
MTLNNRRAFISAIPLAAALLIACGAPRPSAQEPPKAAALSAMAALTAAKSWGYQLQRIRPEALAVNPHDVFVLDYSRDGTDARALTAREIAALKTKPDGSRRVVLAYLSIGEAENYRYYWQPDWDTPSLAPSWLAPANKRWRTNFPVRYWDADWQAIVFAGENSYLARIVAAGFDGVYLDRVDAFEEFESENPAAREQMIAFVASLAAHARTLRPGFLVVPQNAEELLDDASYRATIDAIAKEDLLFGDGRAKRPNKPDRIADTLAHLEHLRPDRKRVFVVEYIDKPEDVAGARTRIEQLGFIPHFADRKLDTMRVGDLPPPKN